MTYLLPCFQMMDLHNGSPLLLKSNGRGHRSPFCDSIDESVPCILVWADEFDGTHCACWSVTVPLEDDHEGDDPARRELEIELGTGENRHVMTLSVFFHDQGLTTVEI